VNEEGTNEHNHNKRAQQQCEKRDPAGRIPFTTTTDNTEDDEEDNTEEKDTAAGRKEGRLTPPPTERATDRQTESALRGEEAGGGEGEVEEDAGEEGGGDVVEDDEGSARSGIHVAPRRLGSRGLRKANEGVEAERCPFRKQGFPAGGAELDDARAHDSAALVSHFLERAGVAEQLDVRRAAKAPPPPATPAPARAVLRALRPRRLLAAPGRRGKHLLGTVCQPAAEVGDVTGPIEDSSLSGGETERRPFFRILSRYVFLLLRHPQDSRWRHETGGPRRRPTLNCRRRRRQWC